MDQEPNPYGSAKVWDPKLERYISADDHTRLQERRARRRKQVREAVKRHYRRKQQQDPDWRARGREAQRARFLVSRREAVAAARRGELPPGVDVWTGATLTPAQLLWVWEAHLRHEALPADRLTRRLAKLGIYEDPALDPVHPDPGAFDDVAGNL